MSHATYPFPLAVNSSHHSDYHRFLLGADPGLLAPFPKPRCIGALTETMPDLSLDLNLAKWRKLYHASIPWRPGFGPAHYSLRNVAPHRPLPSEYARPPRKFGAYDFVQIADPSVSALALVAGDERVLSGFIAVNDDFCRRTETRAAAYRPGQAGSPVTGRGLVGQFAEPNNRWLMPLLHVHNRFLNFTSFAEDPATLHCIDPGELARAARQARSALPSGQAQVLAKLGYRTLHPGESEPGIRVEGVPDRLLAAMEAPRIAVLRLLERMLGENGGSQIPRFGGQSGAGAIAAMADRLEAMLVNSLSFYRPPKLALPSAGPWRSAVRANLAEICPDELAELDRAAARARIARGGRLDDPHPAAAHIFTASPLDHGHRHAPSLEALAAREQQAVDSDLVPEVFRGARTDEPCLWLARQYEETLQSVRAEIQRGGQDGIYGRFRSTLLQIDQCVEGASLEELRRADRVLNLEVEQRAKGFAAELARTDDSRWVPERRLNTLEHLFEPASAVREMDGLRLKDRSLGGISL